MSNTVFAWEKVAYCKYYFEDRLCQYTRHIKPKVPTMFNETLDPAFFTKAEKQGLIDEWIPTVRVQMCNGHPLIFKGERATNIWKEWCALVFSKNKRNKKK